jgi:TetR/AcrR family transcriptional regulator, transcriptional repressor for nem operon
MARAESKLDTRRRIVASAGRAIREQGLQKPSVNEVMAGAGLTVGGFYAHFDNKDALFLESLDGMLRDRLQGWLEQIPDVPAVERRKLAARGYLSRRHRNEASERCPMPMVLGELDRVDPRFREVMAEHVQRWTQALTDAADPQDRARALAAVATMVGALSLARALGTTEFSDELLAAAKAAIA